MLYYNIPSSTHRELDLLQMERLRSLNPVVKCCREIYREQL